MSETVREASPSQTALSESALHKKGLCDYVVNVADGCTHGCEFCYVPSMPQIWGDPGEKFADAGIEAPSDAWGEYALYRDDVVENAARDCQRLLPDRWRTTPRGQGVVGISFATDCYMDPRAGALTRGVVETLIGHGRSVRVLTRNPKLLADLHGDFYEDLPADRITIGSSIPTLDAAEAAAIEPGAPPVGHRIDALADLDVPTFVSMSPTYPTQDREGLRGLLETIRVRIDPTVVFHEPINPRSGNFAACVEAAREAGEATLADALDRLRDGDTWREYALDQLRTVQTLAEESGVPVHLWPDERLVHDAPTDAQRAWCQAWRERPTPEAIGDGSVCDRPEPPVPDVATQAVIGGDPRR